MLPVASLSVFPPCPPPLLLSFSINKKVSAEDLESGTTLLAGIVEAVTQISRHIMGHVIWLSMMLIGGSRRCQPDPPMGKFSPTFLITLTLLMIIA